MMSAKYFEYYTIMLRGGAFFRGHATAKHRAKFGMPLLTATSAFGLERRRSESSPQRCYLQRVCLPQIIPAMILINKASWPLLLPLVNYFEYWRLPRLFDYGQI